MQKGPAAFSSAASEVYKNMADNDKKLLENTVAEDSKKTMTMKSIKREGSKLFHKIQLQVYSFVIFLKCNCF